MTTGYLKDFTIGLASAPANCLSQTSFDNLDCLISEPPHQGAYSTIKFQCLVKCEEIFPDSTMLRIPLLADLRFESLCVLSDKSIVHIYSQIDECKQKRLRDWELAPGGLLLWRHK